MTTHPTEGLGYALPAAEAAFRDRITAAGHPLEALATITVIADGDYSVVAKTGPAAIPAEHRDRVADAAVKLADAIDLRVAHLQTKLARAEAIASELADAAEVHRRSVAAGGVRGPFEKRAVELIDRLAGLLEANA